MIVFDVTWSVIRGWTDQMRNPVGFMCVYPPTLIIVPKMVRYLDLEMYCKKVIKVPRIFVFI